MGLQSQNYRERCIQERAYEIWESRGRPAGRPAMYRDVAAREFAMKEGSLETQSPKSDDAGGKR